MEINELYITPHSDTGANDLEIINQHKQLINNEQYEEATTLLDNQGFEKGVRASLLNSIQNKIRKLQLFFLNEFSSNKYVYYSDEEPTLEFMEENGYIIWRKPF